MKIRFTYLLFCLVAACTFANSASFFFYPKEKANLSFTAIKAHRDNLPAQGLIEKNDLFNQARRIQVPPSLKIEVTPSRLFKEKSLLELQVFLPVILPPPKTMD